MAKFTLVDAEVTVGGTDLSSMVRSVTINYNADMQDSTTMGTETRTRIPGLKDWSIEVTFTQNFDSGSVDSVLFSLVGNQTATTVTVKGDASAATSPTNPEYSGSAYVETYQPLQGAAGDLSETQVTFQAAGVLSQNTS